MSIELRIGDECVWIYKGPYGFAVNPESFPAKVIGFTKHRVKITAFDGREHVTATVRPESLRHKITKSRCQCGEPYFIQHSGGKFRKDGKRVFSRKDDTTTSVFRCRRCHRPVEDSVPGAEYQPARSEKQ